MATQIDTLITAARVIDGSGAPAFRADVAIAQGRIHAIGTLTNMQAQEVVDGSGLVLSPGFIDAHAHDDLAVLQADPMWPKLSQGVTTVIVGNCGISAAPVRITGSLPEPMSLLGAPTVFTYPTFRSYVDAVEAARPVVNVAAFVGHTALRQNHLDRLDRAATLDEITAMRAQLLEALDAGALGLSTGLAYPNAIHAPESEVQAMADALGEAKAIYATHLRDEFGGILTAIDEAVRISRHARAPLVISHLKCAGTANWGRIRDVLRAVDQAGSEHQVGCDCYPYTASSSLLDVAQVADDIDIQITWSTPHPAMGGRLLTSIAAEWHLSTRDAARRLLPAGAVYHCMSEADVREILRHPATVIGSDGLPHDPQPHPRLWGAFPRVLGHYCRDEGLFALPEAVHKMTGMTATRFALQDRGVIREEAWADLVLFDPASICDTATYAQPKQAAEGISAVWVNGVKSAETRRPTGLRAGRFLPRDSGTAATTSDHQRASRTGGPDALSSSH